MFQLMRSHPGGGADPCRNSRCVISVGVLYWIMIHDLDMVRQVYPIGHHCARCVHISCLQTVPKYHYVILSA
jgi:hypothetical protein